MTSLDDMSKDMSKLKALWRARERLETALATDTGWQALLRCRTTAGAGDSETARLQAELMRSNPLYRAWTNINAAIEARQESGAKDVPAVLPAAGDLDTGRPGRRSLEATVGRREFGPRPPPTEEEASVSFVARLPSDGPQVQRAQAVRHTSFPAAQGHEPAERHGAGAVEAEVTVVSVDARRHAGAVDRLLRALRGEINPL